MVLPTRTGAYRSRLGKGLKGGSKQAVRPIFLALDMWPFIKHEIQQCFLNFQFTVVFDQS